MLNLCRAERRHERMCGWDFLMETSEGHTLRGVVGPRPRLWQGCRFRKEGILVRSQAWAEEAIKGQKGASPPSSAGSSVAADAAVSGTGCTAAAAAVEKVGVGGAAAAGTDSSESATAASCGKALAERAASSASVK